MSLKELIVWIVVATWAAACAAPDRSGAPPSARASDAQVTGPKRITAVIAGDPLTLYQKLNPAGTSRDVNGLAAHPRHQQDGRAEP